MILLGEETSERDEKKWRKLHDSEHLCEVKRMKMKFVSPKS